MQVSGICAGTPAARASAVRLGPRVAAGVLAGVRGSTLRLTTAAFAVSLLAGCATFSADGGIARVQALARERLGATATLPRRGFDKDAALAAGEMLGKPLTADAAVRVALLNNPRIRASLAELGVAEADRVQAGRLENPRYSFGNKGNGETVTIDRTLTLNLLSLLAWPLTQKVAGRQFEATQLQAAADVLEVAADARRAWFDAVAAQESLRYAERVAQAASIGEDLARRMVAAGNFSALARMREQAFAVDAKSRLANARLAAALGRERLTRLLGLVGSDIAFTLPERLPELPDAPVAPVDAERRALERRLDVQMAVRSTEALADNLGLAKATRFVNVLELGYANESNTGERRQNGYEISIELPVFDWGDARLARAEAMYMQSMHRTAEVAARARFEVRATYRIYRTAYEVARRYRDEVVPLRKRIADENILRYNGMLISVFELLADAREQIAAVDASIEAARDFWNAETNLQLALNGTSPASGAPSRAGLKPAGAGSGH